MPNWVTLLRGVNVGGGNRVPMADLRRLCEGLGWTDVETYVASGNIVHAADGTPTGLAAGLRAALVSQIGVDVPVLVLPEMRVRHALNDCPFSPEDERQVHAAFLFDVPKRDRSLFEKYAGPGDGLEFGDGVAWLHTPGGFGRSKLAERFEKLVGCPLTARNLRTLRKLVEMLDAR